MYNIGLKLWSTNDFYISKALELNQEGLIHYLELFVVPGSAEKYLDIWKNVEIPIYLHAPHSYTGLNLSLKELVENNRQLINEVDFFRSTLNPRAVIFHPGLNGSLEETIRQIHIFKKEFPELFKIGMLENKPRVGLNGEYCLGASPEEMNQLLSETGLEFCLDFGHAICYSATQKQKYEGIIECFLSLKPKMFHFSDGNIASGMDKHLHLGEGDFKIQELVVKIPKGSCVSIETQKEPQFKLEDFRKDVEYLIKCTLVDLKDTKEIDSVSKLEEVTLRPVLPSDEALLLEIKNESSTVASSFDSRVIEPDEHRQWFQKKLTDQYYLLFIAEIEDKTVGLLRYEIDPKREEAEVHIDVVKGYRGKGYGVLMLKKGNAKLFSLHKVKRILARIRTENKSSIRLFQKSGFVDKGNVEYRTHLCVEMEFPFTLHRLSRGT